jgi:hypothetical protein
MLIKGKVAEVFLVGTKGRGKAVRKLAESLGKLLRHDFVNVKLIELPK